VSFGIQIKFNFSRLRAMKNACLTRLKLKLSATPISTIKHFCAPRTDSNRPRRDFDKAFGMARMG